MTRNGVEIQKHLGEILIKVYYRHDESNSEKENREEKFRIEL